MAEGNALLAAELRTLTAETVREMLRDGIDLVLMGMRVHFCVESVTPMKKAVKAKSIIPSNMPGQLKTPQALKLWKKLQEKGWINENFQPLLSRAKSAILAHTMAEILEIQNMWSTFEAAWHIKALRSAYNDGVNQKGISGFLDEMNEISI